MKQLLTVVAIIVVLAGTTMAQETSTPHPQVVMETSEGEIVLELYPDQAPLTVRNFLNYVESSFFNSTIFHRVIPGFMIQGGGFTSDMQKKPTLPPIKCEANNGLKNDRGTIAMARTRNPHSATAQFFINTVDNTFLNYKSPTVSGWGYAVFGKVIQGMQVVDAISKVETFTKGPYRNVPKATVEIIQISILDFK